MGRDAWPAGHACVCAVLRRMQRQGGDFGEALEAHNFHLDLINQQYLGYEGSPRDCSSASPLYLIFSLIHSLGKTHAVSFHITLVAYAIVYQEVRATSRIIDVVRNGQFLELFLPLTRRTITFLRDQVRQYTCNMCRRE